MSQRFSKKSIISWILLVIVVGVIGQQLFVNKLDFKVSSCEKEKELLIEQFNHKLTKLNKQLVAIKDENLHIKSFNQELENQLEEFRNKEYNIVKKLDKIKAQKTQLENTYIVENNFLQNKLKTLNVENSTLQDLIKELQLQIKNYKINSYGLFQAGKLEVELSNLDQQLMEQYENIAQKKAGIEVLKNKCGKLRSNSKFCKEYDAVVNSIALLEKHLEHAQHKREDLKQRINVYLSSSVQTTPH